MAPPLSHLRLLAPPLRLLLGAMWRVARQQAHEHYGMLEEIVAAATEAVPELLSVKEKSVLLLALRTKMFLCDPDPSHLDRGQVTALTDGEWEESMSCLKDAVSKGLDPRTLSEVFGREFDDALESLLRHFLSRLQQRLPVPDFTKVSTLLQDDWLEDCLQEVKSQELKELLTNHSAVHQPPWAGAEPKSEVVLKSAWQQLQHLQKTDESTPTNQKRYQPKTSNETQELSRSTNQRPAVPKLPPAAANRAPVFTLLNLLPNQTTLLLIPANQQPPRTKPANQQPPGTKPANQQQATPKSIHLNVVSAAEPANQEPPLEQAEGSDQSQPSTEALPPDSVSQNSRRLAQKCPECHKCFFYRSQVLKHLASSRSCSSASGPIGSLRCFQCPAAFQTKAELRTHLLTHRAQHPALGKPRPQDTHLGEPCPQETATTPPTARRRVRQQGAPKDTPFGEPRPQDTPTTPPTAKRGVRQQGAPKDTPEKPRSFSCSLCESSFRMQPQLLTHLDEHLVQGDTPKYDCLYCEQSFTGSTLLRLHQREHVPRPFTCSMCGKSFSSVVSLSCHKRLHGEKRFLCHLCGRGFFTRSSLQSHTHIHSNHTPFTCTLCGRGFKFKPALKVHLRRHLGDKPYSCSVCGKSFSSKGDLGPHMRVHTGEKPYSCKNCGRSFTVSSQLYKHLRTHSGEKLHPCPECGKRFSTKTNLERHLMVHRNQRPFPCPHCPKAYTCEKHLRRHRNTCKNT